MRGGDTKKRRSELVPKVLRERSTNPDGVPQINIDNAEHVTKDNIYNMMSAKRDPRDADSDSPEERKNRKGRARDPGR